MYCAASVNYRPMIADIRESKLDPARQAERACNQAILAAMDSDDETLLAQREQACSAQR
jgi:hypothetical protein